MATKRKYPDSIDDASAGTLTAAQLLKRVRANKLDAIAALELLAEADKPRRPTGARRLNKLTPISVAKAN